MPDKVAVSREKLDSLADVIGAKSERGVPLTFEAMEDAVLGIETGIVPSGTASITSNGVHDVAKYAEARVSVRPKLQSKTVHPSTEVQGVVADSGYDGLDEVVVEEIDLYDATVTPSDEAQVIVPIENSVEILSEKSTYNSASSSGLNAVLHIPEDVLDKIANLDVHLSFSVTGYGPSSGKSDSVENSFVLSSGCDISYPNDGHYLKRLSVYKETNTYYLMFSSWWKGIGTYAYSITADIPHDALSSVTVNPIPSEYIIPTGTKSITENGTGIDVAQYASVDVDVPIPTPTLQSKSVSYTPSETAQSATVSPDSGYDGLSSVDVSVGAISSTYVGSGITQRSSTDLTASGATVTVPAGYYSAQASASVASGTAGTPTATKGTVSNHSVSVTPSVTNTAGYISGGTKSGTAVTVSASELVSGSETKTANGTYDVTNLASLVVDIDFATYYTSTSTPASSDGSDGDIWLVTA